MRIYIKNYTYPLNSKKIIKILFDIGIKKNIHLSDCVRTKELPCPCESFNLKKGDLLIDFGEPRFIYPTILRKIKFIKEFLEKKGDINNSIFGCDGIYGLYSINNEIHDISIFTGKIYEGGTNIKNVLKHELLHIKIEKHCVEKNCLFNKEYCGKNFCKKHQKIYNKIIQKIK